MLVIAFTVVDDVFSNFSVHLVMNASKGRFVSLVILHVAGRVGFSFRWVVGGLASETIYDLINPPILLVAPLCFLTDFCGLIHKVLSSLVRVGIRLSALEVRFDSLGADLGLAMAVAKGGLLGVQMKGVGETSLDAPSDGSPKVLSVPSEPGVQELGKVAIDVSIHAFVNSSDGVIARDLVGFGWVAGGIGFSNGTDVIIKVFG